MFKKKIKKIVAIFMVCIMSLAITTLALADDKDDKGTVLAKEARIPNPDGINVYDKEIHQYGSVIVKSETVQLDYTAYDGPEEFNAALENSSLNRDIVADMRASMLLGNNSTPVNINTILNLALFNCNNKTHK